MDRDAAAQPSAPRPCGSPTSISRCAFDAGEEMRTEISAKFRRERVEAELRAVGLELAEWWTDSTGSFALSLSAIR